MTPERLGPHPKHLSQIGGKGRFDLKLLTRGRMRECGAPGVQRLSREHGVRLAVHTIPEDRPPEGREV